MNNNTGWLIRMAWRDSRKNRARLLLFVSSIVLGIAALVAIQSFGENLKAQIELEAKALLGADLEIEGRQPVPEGILKMLDSLGAQTIREVNFASMVQATGTGGTRLVNVRAVEKGYPFYGNLETVPAAAGKTFTGQGASAVAAEGLLQQLGATPGDTLAVGAGRFTLLGAVKKVPGQSGIAATVAPPVFIPYGLVDSTGLLQRGSRVNHRLYVKFSPAMPYRLYEELIIPRLEKAELRYDDVAERKKDLGDAYSDLSAFLNLTAFIALLLGCIGVASSVQVYMKEKVQMVAVLRCMGASGPQAMAIFMVQIALMGFAGALLGAALGTAIQFLLPLVFADLLPVEVKPAISPTALVSGIFTGTLASVIFSLWPLLAIRKVSALAAIRAAVEKEPRDMLRYSALLLIGLFVVGFARLQLGTWKNALFFTLGLAVALLLLAGFARLIIFLVRRFFPLKSSFIWRHGLSNLFRPNNQTLLLVVTIGLGTALIGTLLLSQQLLLNKVKFNAAPASRPNMVIFDIQGTQVQPIQQLLAQYQLPQMGSVPIVTMRMHSLKGKTVDTWKEDTAVNMRKGLLTREYRVTYRDSLIDSEKLLEGSWKGRVARPGDSIFISMEQGIAQSMQLKIGDEVVFNVQGALMPTYIGSLRKVDFQRVQTNFLVLFPAGVLEQAPQFHVQLTRFDSVGQSAKFQTALVRQFPNASVIDLNLVLETVDEILDKVSFVIRFMAFFSVLTGLIVLIGSVIISKYQRIQESVLLRTLGAGRRQITGIQLVEYFLLGSLSAITGLIIALLAAWALATFSFDTFLLPEPLPLLGLFAAITGITVGIGLLNSREVVSKPPLEILRKEV
jgi:putative ABC transport system permease protein